MAHSVLFLVHIRYSRTRQRIVVRTVPAGARDEVFENCSREIKRSVRLQLKAYQSTIKRFKNTSEEEGGGDGGDQGRGAKAP